MGEQGGGCKVEVILKIICQLEEIISIIIISVLVFNVYLKEEKIRKLNYEKCLMEKYAKKQEERIELIAKKNEDIRRFRHDMKGHMMVLGCLVKQKKMEETYNYIAKIADVIDINESDTYTGIVAIDAVITERLREIEKENIDFSWNGRIKGCENRIEVYDLCTIFANLIENAVEACKKMSEKRFIEVKVLYIEGEVNISIRNSMDNKAVYKNGEFVTTKKEVVNHGIGMKNIKKAVNRYNGVYTNRVKKGIFETIIVL